MVKSRLENALCVEVDNNPVKGTFATLPALTGSDFSRYSAAEEFSMVRSRGECFQHAQHRSLLFLQDPPTPPPSGGTIYGFDSAIVSFLSVKRLENRSISSLFFSNSASVVWICQYSRSLAPAPERKAHHRTHLFPPLSSPVISYFLSPLLVFVHPAAKWNIWLTSRPSPPLVLQPALR